MRSTSPPAPTLLTRPTTACPRCDSREILGLAVHSDSAFYWRECGTCGYLWALPQSPPAYASVRVTKSAIRKSR